MKPNSIKEQKSRRQKKKRHELWGEKNGRRHKSSTSDTDREPQKIAKGASYTRGNPNKLDKGLSEGASLFFPI